MMTRITGDFHFSIICFQVWGFGLARKRARERASTVFSELATELCLRFRVEPVPSAHRGRVQWCQKLYGQFFFSAGNVFFERNRKIPLCFFIFPEGPRVTEVTKLKILSQLEDWEYTNTTINHKTLSITHTQPFQSIGKYIDRYI